MKIKSWNFMLKKKRLNNQKRWSQIMRWANFIRRTLDFKNIIERIETQKPPSVLGRNQVTPVTILPASFQKRKCFTRFFFFQLITYLLGWLIILKEIWQLYGHGNMRYNSFQTQHRIYSPLKAQGWHYLLP